MALPVSTIASIVLILLKLADKFSDSVQARKYKDEGYEKAKAEYNAKMLKNNEYAQEIIKRVNNLSDSGVDDLLRELEPKST